MSAQGFSVATAWLKDDFLFRAISVMDKARRAQWARVALRYRSWFIGIFQAQLIFLALLVAWLLRFNFSLPNRALFLSAAPVLIIIRLIAVNRFGLMHGWWRYTDIDDAVAIGKAIATGSIAFVICMHLFLGMAAFPRAIYVLEPLLSILLLGGVRLGSRLTLEALREETLNCRKVILIGAGAAAEKTLREIARRGSGYRPVGCLDDDRSKLGVKIHGVSVLGTVDDLPRFVSSLGVKDVWIAIPSATRSQMQRFAELCAKADVQFKAVRSLSEMLTGRTDIPQPREVQPEDLLGRDPVDIDMETVRKQIEGQTVLITGAAGTIGSELCRQALRFCPGKLVCVDRNETGVFYLQMELSRFQQSTQLIYCVTDFGDPGRMKGLLAEHKPVVIFHAAAYKHVPIMEMNVCDAVKNNIFSLLGLLEIAEESGCPSFVLISSDKAVKPTNIMGATKRAGELIISCRPAGSMRCVSVRFGNVLGSNGSVVPVLQKQLRENSQLTITHPEVTRFFMTTREAVSLVLEAFAIGDHADTLVLDMGSPLRILDLAKTLIRLSGKSEDEVNIRFTGLRVGEKLFEELSYPTEVIHPTSSAKIKRICGTPGQWLDITCLFHQLRASMSANDSAAIREMMKKIVPEYSPDPECQSRKGGELVNLEVTPAISTVLLPNLALR